MFRIIKVIGVILLAAIGFICLSTIFTSYLANEKIDTIQLTNIGAASLFAIASVTFNWAKSLDQEKYSDYVKDLNRTAVNSIVAAIVFIVGSLEKYVVIKNMLPNIGNLDIKLVFQIAFFATFIVAWISFPRCPKFTTSDHYACSLPLQVQIACLGLQ
jgi:uncharacterized protein YacL